MQSCLKMLHGTSEKKRKRKKKQTFIGTHESHMENVCLIPATTTTQHFIQNESTCIGINANVSAQIFLKITQPGTKCCKNRFSVRNFLHPSVFADAFLFILHHCFQLQYRLLQFVRQRSRSTCHAMHFFVFAKCNCDRSSRPSCLPNACPRALSLAFLLSW